MEIRPSSLSRTGPLVSSPSAPLVAQEASALAPAVTDAAAGPALGGDALDGAALRADEATASSLALADMGGASPLDPFVAGNAQAIADLSKLQADGKLTPEVMAGFTQLATQPLAPGIDRADLIATALRQLADPSSVNQGDKFTCAPAVVQTMVAKDNPAEYLRLVAGLASPEGTVTLQNGATLTRDANWLSDPTRSVIDNLMQPALMQLASGSYDSATDSRKTATGTGQGLYAAEQDKLIAAVTGRKSTSVSGSGPEVIGQLGKATAAGQNVPAIITYQGANGELKGHAVLVESVKNGKVTYLDPKAGRKTVSLEEFQAKLQSVSLPDELVTPKLASATMKSDEGLLAGGFFKKLAKGIKKAVKGIGNAFAKIGNALKNTLYKIVDVIGPVLPILSVAAWLIPGVGPIIGTALKIAQAVVAGVNAVRAAESGDILGALAAGASAFSGVATGPAAGVAAKFASYANTARSAVSALKSGNVAGALGAIASVTGNQNLATAANVANAVQNQDIGAALGAVGSATGNQTLNRAAALASTAQQIKHAVDSKDFLGAAMTINGLAVDAKILDAGQGQDVRRWLERGQAFDQARRTGDVGQLVDLAAKTAGELGVVTPKEYRKIAPDLKRGLDLYQAAKRGDADAAIRLGSQALSRTGWFAPKTTATAQSLVQQVQPLRQAIASKDYGNVAKLAARMGYDAGVLGLSDPEALAKVEAMASKAARLNEGLEAARRGETLKVAEVADEVFNQGRLQRELDELNELKEAYEARMREAVKPSGQKVK